MPDKTSRTTKSVLFLLLARMLLQSHPLWKPQQQRRYPKVATATPPTTLVDPGLRSDQERITMPSEQIGRASPRDSAPAMVLTVGSVQSPRGREELRAPTTPKDLRMQTIKPVQLLDARSTIMQIPLVLVLTLRLFISPENSVKYLHSAVNTKQ